MRTSELFLNKKVFSFEVFPPKQPAGVETIYETLDVLKTLSPDFISVTYGAGGTKNGSETLEIAQNIHQKYNLTGVAHLPCVYLTKQKAEEIVKYLIENDIENVLALRGDRIEGHEHKTDFIYATDLIAFLKQRHSFNIIAACYPEGHKECASIEEDIIHLKEKVDSGVDNLISQLFFDNNLFITYLEKLNRAKISVPVQAGIMPIMSKAQILRMNTLCGAAIPKKILDFVNKYENDSISLQQAGIEYAINQIEDLLKRGADGIHLYTMNNKRTAREITDAVRSMF